MYKINLLFNAYFISWKSNKHIKSVLATWKNDARICPWKRFWKLQMMVFKCKKTSSKTNHNLDQVELVLWIDQHVF